MTQSRASTFKTHHRAARGRADRSAIQRHVPLFLLWPLPVCLRLFRLTMQDAADGNDLASCRMGAASLPPRRRARALCTTWVCLPSTPTLLTEHRYHHQLHPAATAELWRPLVASNLMTYSWARPAARCVAGPCQTQCAWCRASGCSSVWLDGGSFVDLRHMPTSSERTHLRALLCPSASLQASAGQAAGARTPAGSVGFSAAEQRPRTGKGSRGSRCVGHPSAAQLSLPARLSHCAAHA